MISPLLRVIAGFAPPIIRQLLEIAATLIENEGRIPADTRAVIQGHVDGIERALGKEAL